MDSSSNGSGQEFVYALVSYIDGELGTFLDDLRRELVPGYEPRAHITLMPPRRLCGPLETAWHEIKQFSLRLAPFEIEATRINVFPKTNVIYIDVGEGRGTLMEVHRALNIGCLAFEEQYAYHPHITLAQKVTDERVPALAARAEQAWLEYRGTRRVVIDRLTLVRSLELDNWADVYSLALEHPVPVRKR